MNDAQMKSFHGNSLELQKEINWQAMVDHAAARGCGWWAKLIG